MKRFILTTAAAALATSFAMAQTAESPEVLPDADAMPEAAPDVAQAETPAAPTEGSDGAGLYGVFADMAVRDLVGMNVLVGTGDDIGEIERIVAVSGGDVQAVVGVGGFLGIGEHDVAVPLEKFTRTEDAVMLPDMTEEELEAMAEFSGDAEELPLNVTVSGDPVPEALPVDPTVMPTDGTTEQSN